MSHLNFLLMSFYYNFITNLNVLKLHCMAFRIDAVKQQIGFLLYVRIVISLSLIYNEFKGRLFSTSLCFIITCNMSFLSLSSQRGDHCLCSSGFAGQSCQLGLRDNSGVGQWWDVSTRDVRFSPRTASGGVYLSSTRTFYMFGGNYK